MTGGYFPVLQFRLCARQKFYPEKTTPAAATSRRNRSADWGQSAARGHSKLRLEKFRSSCQQRGLRVETTSRSVTLRRRRQTQRRIQRLHIGNRF
jgi:hypothetical protein